MTPGPDPVDRLTNGAAMPMDTAGYLKEMRAMVTEALARWAGVGAAQAIYSVSIWTDPDALASAVCVDTRANSDRVMEDLWETSRQQRDHFLRAGDERMAALWAEPPAGRNDNPAEFAFANIGTTDHTSFDQKWARSAECWPTLGPLLEVVRDECARLAAGLAIDPEAEVGINDASGWYVKAIRVRA